MQQEDAKGHGQGRLEVHGRLEGLGALQALGTTGALQPLGTTSPELAQSVPKTVTATDAAVDDRLSSCLYLPHVLDRNELVDRLTQHLSKTHGGQRQLKRETMLRLLHKCDWQLTTAANLAEAVLKGDSQALYHLQPHLHSDSDGDDADDNGRAVLTTELHAHTSIVNAHSRECLSYDDSAHSRTHLSGTIFQDKRAVPKAPLPCGPPASPPPQAPRLIALAMPQSSGKDEQHDAKCNQQDVRQQEASVRQHEASPSTSLHRYYSLVGSAGKFPPSRPAPESPRGASQEAGVRVDVGRNKAAMQILDWHSLQGTAPPSRAPPLSPRRHVATKSTAQDHPTSPLTSPNLPLTRPNVPSLQLASTSIKDTGDASRRTQVMHPEGHR